MTRRTTIGALLGVAAAFSIVASGHRATAGGWSGWYGQSQTGSCTDAACDTDHSKLNANDQYRNVLSYCDDGSSSADCANGSGTCQNTAQGCDSNQANCESANSFGQTAVSTPGGTTLTLHRCHIDPYF